MLEEDLVSLFCIVYLCQRTIFPGKEVFDNFYGSFADCVEDEKKGAEKWLEDTI